MASYLTHLIQQGETLQGIANEELSDVNRWHELVTLNHLDFPYIVRSGHQKAKGLCHRNKNGHLEPLHWLTYGDEIKLPLTDTVGDQAIAKADSFGGGHKVYDTVLGEDLKLGFNVENHAGGSNLGDQVAFLQLNKKHNDLATVSGIDNLMQSIHVRLITEEGSVKDHPHFGSRLNQLIGASSSTSPDSLCQDIANEIERTVNTDKRVRKCSVSECHLIDEDFFAVANVTPITPYKAFTMYVESEDGGWINTSLDRSARKQLGETD